MASVTSPNKREFEFGSQSIETLLTTTATEIDEWIRDIYTLLNGNGAVVGLCIQSKPPVYERSTFSGSVEKIASKPATLQLCVGTKCLFIQLLYLDHIPKSLKSFMLDPCFIFVGLGINCSNIHGTIDFNYGLVCGRFEYLHELGKTAWPLTYEKNSEASLTELARFAGLDYMEIIPFEIYMSNWENLVLNSEQIKYGSIYAHAISEIGLAMLKCSSNCWV